MVCTEKYKQRYEGKASTGEGKGAKWEGFIITSELYEAEAKNTKFIPVVFRPQDARHIPAELRAASRYDLSTADAYEDLLRHLTNQPRRKKSPVASHVRAMPPLAQATGTPPLPRKQQFSGRLWNVPIARNRFFTGREWVLADVEKELHAGRSVALTGMGGVGKTQIAAQYAHEHRDEHSAVLWASAVSEATLVSDFAAIAVLLGLFRRKMRRTRPLRLPRLSAGLRRMAGGCSSSTTSTTWPCWTGSSLRRPEDMSS